MDIIQSSKVNHDDLVQELINGHVLIYPTDTVYGIGCDATSDSAVKNIRRAKQQFDRPFSVIAPSRAWILKNCAVGEMQLEWIDKLPGPYTLILRFKNQRVISKETNLEKMTLGIRMPKHWVTDVVAKAGIPVITTSVNIHGQPFAHELKDIPKEIARYADLAIDEGRIDGKPSTIVDLTGDEPVIRERQ